MIAPTAGCRLPYLGHVRGGLYGAPLGRWLIRTAAAAADDARFLLVSAPLQHLAAPSPYSPTPAVCLSDTLSVPDGHPANRGHSSRSPCSIQPAGFTPPSGVRSLFRLRAIIAEFEEQESALRSGMLLAYLP